MLVAAVMCGRHGRGASLSWRRPHQSRLIMIGERGWFVWFAATLSLLPELWRPDTTFVSATPAAVVAARCREDSPTNREARQPSNGSAGAAQSKQQPKQRIT